MIILLNLNRVTREVVELKSLKEVSDNSTEDLLDISIQKKTPKDTNELRLSGTTTVEKKSNRKYNRVGFRGGQVD